MKRLFWQRIWAGLGLVFYLVSGSLAADLTLPPSVEPGAVFLVEVALESAESPAQLTFEPAAAQYSGPVTPTPEIQFSGDHIVEITKTAAEKKRFGLKFLALPTASTSAFVLKVAEATKSGRVQYEHQETEKSYHFHVLGLAVVLLLVGRFLYRYQKKAPALMSTRSLFMNFEELQKAREKYGLPPESAGGSPETVGGSPETVGGSPETVGGSPETVGGSPESPAAAFPATLKAPVAPKTPDTPAFSVPSASPESPISPPTPPTPPTAPSFPIPPVSPNAPSISDPSASATSPTPATLKTPMPPSVQPPSSEPVSQTKKGLPGASASGSPPEVPVRPQEASDSDAAPAYGSASPSTRRVALKEVQRSLDAEKTDNIDKTDKTAPSVSVAKSFPETSPKQPGTPVQMIRLVLKSENGTLYSGEAPEITIGRRKGNTILFTGSEISRDHAVICRSGSGFTLGARAPNNVTEVNGRPVKSPVPIKAGDTLSLGGTIYVVEELT